MHTYSHEFGSMFEIGSAHTSERQSNGSAAPEPFR